MNNYFKVSRTIRFNDYEEYSEWMDINDVEVTHVNVLKGQLVITYRKLEPEN